MRKKICLALILVAALSVIGWTVKGQRRGASTAASPVWEYKVVYVPGARKMAEETLNKMGEQGWEMITFQQINQEGVTIGAGNFYFKRQRQ